jgi:exodeoxyribonuclease VII large subunit
MGQIRQYRQRTDALDKFMRTNISSQLELAKSRLNNSSHALNTVSPLATLSRGYSISRKLKTHVPLKDAGDITIGEPMETQLSKGTIISRVESIDE